MIVIADATARARRRAEMQAGLAEAREEGLRDEIESLRESEERFRRSADAANALVFEVGLRDRSAPAKVYGLQRLIGFDPSEVRADYKWWVSRIHPDDLPRYEKELHEQMRAGGAHRHV
jgi:hypothetical protein